MSSSSSSSAVGISFIGLLAIVFIVLKLTHYIAWSWWWALSPIWIPAIIALIIIIIMLLGYFFSKK